MTTVDGLNEEQRAAALDTEGAVLVTAGAGSGKTRLLTHRIAHIVQDLGVPSYRVLAITFTNKAAEEMKNRIQSLIGTSEVWISTFHSMCAKILRRHGEKLGYSSHFTIYAQDETERTVKQIVKDLEIEGDNFWKTAVHGISDAKNKGLSPEEYADFATFDPDVDEICAVYRKYEEYLKRNNAVDFDDLLLKTRELFEKCPDVLEGYRRRFRYIHVDEFQDTNAIQYSLVRLLAGERGNVFVVGDEDQSIYGWRGAEVSNMQGFIEDFGAKIYKLEQNYRSTEHILTAANRLIKHNVSRIDKNLWSALGDGEPVVAYRAADEAGEADFVVNTVNKLIRDEGYRPHDFAVLMRVNALTRLLEQRFMQYNLPYKVYGGFKFFDRKEVKDILAYLRIVSNPFDGEAILRIINFPRRGIGDGTVAQLNECAAREETSLFDVLTDIDRFDLPTAVKKKCKPFGEMLKKFVAEAGNMSVAELTERVIREAGIKEAYAEDTEENTARRLNIDDFVSSVYDFEKNQGGTLDDFLESVTLYTEGDDDNSSDSIFISTVHSAKGMEFRCVFVVGAEEGLFPLSRASDEPDELEEERRLMYVAITRAKERLYLSFCTTRYMYGERKYCRPSRFFEEIDESFASTFESGNAADDRNRYGSGYGGYGKRTEFGTSKNRPAEPGMSGVAKQNAAVKQNNAALGDYEIGMRVVHKKFGEGTVAGVTNVGTNSYIVIEFDSIGKLTLSLAFAPIRKL